MNKSRPTEKSRCFDSAPETKREKSEMFSGFAYLTLICIFIELVVPQKFQMKDLLMSFQGVMNFAMFTFL